MQTTAMKIVAMLAITIQKIMIMTIMRPHFTMQASAINAVVELLPMLLSFRRSSRRNLLTMELSGYCSSRRWGHSGWSDEEDQDGGAADKMLSLLRGAVLRDEGVWLHVGDRLDEGYGCAGHRGDENVDAGLPDEVCAQCSGGAADQCSYRAAFRRSDGGHAGHRDGISMWLISAMQSTVSTTFGNRFIGKVADYCRGGAADRFSSEVMELLFIIWASELADGAAKA